MVLLCTYTNGMYGNQEYQDIDQKGGKWNIIANDENWYKDQKYQGNGF